MNSTPTPRDTPALPPKDVPATSSTGPNRQRRRPRKLNKEPAPQTADVDTRTPSSSSANYAPPSTSTTELEALKYRVRGLEAKVEQLYQAGVARGKSPRRRGKGRKNSMQTIPSTPEETPKAVHIDDDVKELTRLEGELEIARQDLESYSGSKGRARKSAHDDIEEVARDGMGVDDMADTGGRQVTLTGNYRIPLPSSVSMTDVKNIQSGVSAAQNVARSFLEQRRAQQVVQEQAKPNAPSMRGEQRISKAVAKENDGKQSWSEWFGGYSMAISRAVGNIEAEAAIESQRAAGPTRPSQGNRMASAPSAKCSPALKPLKKANTRSGAKGETRPPLKPRAGNFSSEQVHELMS
ncbi:hypothetical protein CC78DRAFT_126795 [Lojkania enalia]|uniref:Uncharacterized protein n=1 Tax=Lojkania enalia TaxID=147567 RepID=A0A9P4JXJ7_9PLEO|nr:hypothetical protein CC78DRAFT_126795 [Didymosphaeria enalia]